MTETTTGHSRETRTPTSETTGATAWHQKWQPSIGWDQVLIWIVIVAALALVAAATVLLFLGLLEMIAVVSPVLVALLLVWTAFLTIKTVKLENRLDELEKLNR